MPFFTVIMPCYNASKHLRETLDSLRAQSFTDWELIAMDDGSSDATLSILHHYQTLDPRIQVHSQKNAGPSIARNTAVTFGAAPYLAFLDADDLWEDTKLEFCHDVLTSPKAADAVFGRINFFADDHRFPSTSSTVKPQNLELTDVLGENPMCTLSNLVIDRRTFLEVGGFDPSIVYAEDLEFLARLLAQGHSVRGFDTLMVHYRTSTDGLSANLKAMHDGWRGAVKSAQRHGATLDTRQIAHAEAIHLRYLARRALRIGQSQTAFRLTIKGMTISPAGFLSNRYRGFATLFGSLAAPILPRSVCIHIFAE